MKTSSSQTIDPVASLSLFLPSGILDYFTLVNHVSQDTCFILYLEEKGLSLKPWGIALKFLFLHHENILFPND
ncbi:hypothetical protein HMPREF0106_05013 [Bacteroides sp. D22]|nr:hypothetical protein HMPREF0106_05013 [Bacteroides sp. D22]